MKSLAGRPRLWAAGLVVLLVLTVAVVAWLALRPDTYVAAPPQSAQVTQNTASPDLATTALERLGSAMAGGDPEAAARLGVDAQTRSLLRAVVQNAARLGVTDFSARYVDELGAVDSRGRWTAAVDLTWRFDGYDEGAVHEEVAVGFAAAGEAVKVTGFGGGGKRSPLWLTGPVAVREQGPLLVLGPDEAAVDRYARLARRAVPIVGRVVSRWSGPLVVEVPASEAALDGALGASPGTYAGVAAVTASVDGSSAAGAPVHVFVNPEVMAALDTQGAQIVLSHEVTHAATRAATNPRRPIWLTEGFADYVALRDVRLPLSTTAGQIIKQTRSSGPPDHLPGPADFDSHSSSFGAEYEAAWLVCRVIADRAGEKGLVELYDRVGAGQEVDAVLQDVADLGTRGLTRLWQRRLSDLAG